MDHKIIAINLGSTSTKISYYVNDEEMIGSSIRHDSKELDRFTDIWDQLDYRTRSIEDFIRENGIDISEIDAFVTRGGHTEPISGGTYNINEAMIAQNRTGRYGVHVCNLGLEIVKKLAENSPKAITITRDTPTSDELSPLARYSGLSEISRSCRCQFLNHKAIARYYAKKIEKNYEDLNLIVVMMGGGITVAAHSKGKMIDGPDGLTGEGPFSNNRAGTLPPGELIRLCYSGKYSEKEMLRHINGEAGLISYLGSTDVISIQDKALNGDEKCKEVLEAMCYQTSKEIGAMATVMSGKVDAIILTGGMANSEFLTDLIIERVNFIAPVVILPGEKEMESLALGAYDVLTGKEELKEFVPKETNV